MIRPLQYIFSLFRFSSFRSHLRIVFALFFFLCLFDESYAQEEEGTDYWIGHVYDKTDFTQYRGYILEYESFSQNFRGNYRDFPLKSPSGETFYTQYFAMRFRMKSTRTSGIYAVNLANDDGAKLWVDGLEVYKNWTTGYDYNPNQLLVLGGDSHLVYEYFENGGLNLVAFLNLRPLIENVISPNATQELCLQEEGGVILSGGQFVRFLPNGVQDPIYRWAYSLTNDGENLNFIAEENNSSFKPSVNSAPLNQEGTYYLYRVVSLRSFRNKGFNDVTFENISNPVKIIVRDCCKPFPGNPDSDNDGVADKCDLDDDNDGILDTDECGSIDNIEINRKGNFTESFSQRGTFRIEADFYTLDNSTRIIINGQDIVGGSGYNGVGSTGILTAESGGGLSNGDHLLNFLSDQALFDRPWRKNTNNLPRLKIVVTESGVELSGTRSLNSSSMETVTIADGSLVIPNFNEGINNVTLVVPDGPGPDGAIVSFYMEARGCFRDTDGDGIKNNLDLDSDNDGCPDAIEGGANFNQDDLTSENTLCNSASCVDANGVPTVANGGQSLGAANKPVFLSFEEQPVNEEVCLGSDASFTAKGKAVVATVYNNGIPDFVNNTTLEPVKYQWQKYNSASTEWDDIAGETGTIGSGVEISLNLGAQNDLSNSNSKYRLKLTSEGMSCPIYSDEVTLVVNSLPNNISSTSGFKGGKFCKGEQPRITFNGIEGGNYPYTIVYVDNNNAQYTQTINTSSEQAFDAPNLDVNSASGTYRYKLISITDAKGCSLSESASISQINSVFGKKRARIRIRENPADVVTMSIDNNSVCLGGVSPIVTFTNSDNKPIIITYNINGGISQTKEVPRKENSSNGVSTIDVQTSTAGIYNYNVTAVRYKSSPGCDESINISRCIAVFPKNSTAPIVSSPNNTAIVVTPPATVSGFSIEYSFDDGATWGANTPPITDKCDGYKIKTRYVLAQTCGSLQVGSTISCAESPSVTRVLDTTSPLFTANNKEFCVENIFQAAFNGVNDITPSRPDYYLLESGDTSLDLGTFSDNCCATESMTIRWTINFEGGTPAAISGIGQPSMHGSEIQLPGDGVGFQDKVHSITYRLTDCNGNYTEKTINITIKPRPKIDRVNN